MTLAALLLCGTGTEQQRITVGTSSGSPPCVWALEVLPDGTLVSGDQEGAVQFWDGRFGTLLTRHQQFVADVLTLAASPDGKMVWASGVDPKVTVTLGSSGCYSIRILHPMISASPDPCQAGLSQLPSVQGFDSCPPCCTLLLCCSTGRAVSVCSRQGHRCVPLDLPGPQAATLT